MEDGFAGIGLNLGCGKIRWPFPWKNIDFDQGDIHDDLRKLHLPDEYATAIAAIHVIEHFHQWEACDLLTEWHRVLKTGGKLILELPSMEKVISYLHQCMLGDKEISPAMSWFVFWGDPKYKNPLMVHKWGYTQAMLKKLLESVGFHSIEFSKARYHFPFRDMRVEAIK